jgi:hypothetical protein
MSGAIGEANKATIVTSATKTLTERVTSMSFSSSMA